MNFGVLLGDVIAIDIDVKRPPDGTEENGLISWECIQEHYATRFPHTVMSFSGRGGGCGHIFFRTPAGLRIRNHVNLLRGVDLKAAGGYVVLPGSCHVTGTRYCWRPDASPIEAAVASLPPVLLELASDSDTLAIRKKRQNSQSRPSLRIKPRSETESLLKDRFGIDIRTFRIRANAAPPPWKLNDLLSRYKENHARILATYEMRRGPDGGFAMRDHSTSAYEQSLADFAACNKWTPQQVVDLIVFWRNRHGVSLQKLSRSRVHCTLEKAFAVALRYGRVRKRPGRPLSETTKAILELHKTGWTTAAIADHLALKQGCVRVAIMRHGSSVRSNNRKENSGKKSNRRRDEGSPVCRNDRRSDLGATPERVAESVHRVRDLSRPGAGSNETSSAGEVPGTQAEPASRLAFSSGELAPVVCPIPVGREGTRV
jgi:hypothetical protein